MNFIEIAANLLSSKTGLDQQSAAKTIQQLIGDGQGGIDLNRVINNFQQLGVSDLVSSWLSTGENLPVEANTVENALGSDTINQAAQSAGLEKNMLTETLSDILPQLIDKASPQGSLLDNLGGAAGLLNLAQNFFRK